MLHTLNPTDTDALILLAKALAARKHWQEAKHYLSVATENGAKIPKQVEDFIEQGLIRDLHNADVERKRALACLSSPWICIKLPSGRTYGSRP